MPRRDDIHKILLIGSGPIVIGQAAEFDYSGTQACRVLAEEGYEVVLVNSNPATIMTDPELAAATYVEPLLPGPVTQVIERERPDALLATLGGQTALNLAKALYEDGTLERLGVELIGADYDAIDRAEDRERFRETMTGAGLRVPRSAIAVSIADAEAAIDEIGLPFIVRPAFTLGGSGGGVVRDAAELATVVGRGLRASPIGQVLLEESVLGWGEFELEVMRDHSDNVVIVCSIENLDPMGVHTGDSVCVAPQQTLTDKQYQLLRDQAIAVIRAVGVETGGSNVQFAVNPATDEIVVIEMNPRVSRSSALASKATGFPIAKIAARLAVGYTLQEIPNDITRATPASFEPAIDYCVVKWPRFAFEKFPGAEAGLTTHMKSVGEVDGDRPDVQAGVREGAALPRARHRAATGVRRGAARGDRRAPAPTASTCCSRRCAAGSDRRGPAADRHRPVVPARAARAGLRRCAVRRASGRSSRSTRARPSSPPRTPYYYSSWERPRARGPANEVERGERPSVVILGSGPNRIGQGIEFDYCCVHAAQTVRESGRDAVMINCNPETVSTDYDTSDRLYFEPLTLEDVLAVCEVEQPEGVIVQFGGQTPLKLAAGLDEAGVPILGTSIDAIDLAEDRARFGALLDRARLHARRRTPPPRGPEEALGVRRAGRVPAAGAAELRARRPRDGDRLQRRRPARLPRTGRHRSRTLAIYLDRFLEDSIEVDVDAICDGDDVWVAGIMQHVEEAGIHSGDSACVLPPHTLGAEMLEQIREQTVGIARALGVVGLLNVQFAIHRRAGPARDRGQPARLADGAVRVQGDRAAARQARLPGDARREARRPRAAGGHHQRPRVRQGGGAAVQPLHGRRLAARARDALDRRGDGDRPGLPDRVREGPGRGRGASCRTPARCSSPSPTRDKPAATGLAALLHELGFRIIATRGTAQAIRRQGIPAEAINKIGEGSPHVVDWIERGDVDLVINTPVGTGARSDGYEIRTAAIARGIPCITTIVRRDRRRTGDLGGAPRRARRCSRSRRSTPSAERPGAQDAGGALTAGRSLAPVRAQARGGARRPRLTARTSCCAAPISAGPAPQPGQFYMLAASTRWGGGDGERPFLPRAFSVLRARGRPTPAAIELQFLVEDVGPGTRRLCELARRRRAAARRAARDGLRVAARGAPAAARRRRRRDRAARDPPGRARRRARRCCSGSATRAHAAGAALLTGARVATDDGSVGHHGLVTELLGARARAGRRRARGLRLRAAADARGGPADVRRALECPRSSRSSPGWRADSGRASAAWCRPATATSGCAWKVLCSTPAVLEAIVTGQAIERHLLRHRARAPDHQRLGHVRRDRRAPSVRRRAARAVPVRGVRHQDGHGRAAPGQPAAAAVGAPRRG